MITAHNNQINRRPKAAPIIKGVMCFEALDYFPEVDAVPFF